MSRYQTEGSRGAIKDKAGTGHPSVRIDGYSRPAKIQIFIGTDTGKISPHLFYQVCRVTGKHSSPCEEVKINGTDVIEIISEPVNDNTVICDCVGILKERFADVEQRFPKHKNWKNSKKKSTKCRMIFRTTIENVSGETEVLQIVSDVINCTQLPGTPEILKMSVSASPSKGGDELWIIGKNFMKDTKVVFSHSSPGKEEPLWTKMTEPATEFFHQTHLITEIPPFYNLDLTESVDISVYIKCGDKLSDTVPFTYTPLSVTHSSLGATVGTLSLLPKGVSEPAVAINNQFAKTGSVSVITGTGVSNGKLTNGDVIIHNHKNKKSKMDFSNKNNRRTRSVPRPNLIEEDTVFATEKDFKSSSTENGKVNSGGGTLTSFSQLSWQRPAPAPAPTRNIQDQAFTQKFSSNGAMRMRNSLSVSVDEDSRTFTQDDHHEESSFHSPPRVDFSSSLTRDFSGAFNLKPNEEPPKQRLSFAGALMTQTQTQVNQKASAPTVQSSGAILENACYISPKLESVQNINNVQQSTETHETPNVSVTKSKEEKATISISLPTSILKDQKHFQSVIETINNTLLTKNTDTEEKQESTVTNTNVTVNSPSRKITSMPVSVLSNTRKRNISSELVNQSQSGPGTEILSTTSPYMDHMSPMSSISQSQSPYQHQPVTPSPKSSYQGVTSPISSQAPAQTQQEIAQEKKWNAEFNQVLQTVIEQQNNASGGMDWSQDTRGDARDTSNWTQSVTHEKTGDQSNWTQETNKQSEWTQETNNQPEWTQKTNNQSEWTQKTNNQSEWTQETNNQSEWTQDTINQSEWRQNTSDESDWTQSAARVETRDPSMDWCTNVTKSVAETPATTEEFLVTTDANVLVLNPPDSVSYVSTTQTQETSTNVFLTNSQTEQVATDQFASITSHQQQQCSNMSATVAVEDFIQNSPSVKTNFSSYNSPAGTVSTPASVEQFSTPASVEQVPSSDPLLFEVKED